MKMVELGYYYNRPNKTDKVKKKKARHIKKNNLVLLQDYGRP